MLVDTDVLIWYMKGNSQAFNIIENLPGFYMSVISYMELVQGMRNKNEFTELRKALRSWNTKILFVSEEISAKAMFYVEKHYLSHSPEMADALIAATAVANQVPILTANDKHYKMIKELRIRQFRPD